MLSDLYKFSDSSDRIPELMHEGHSYVNDSEKAEMFNQLYTSSGHDKQQPYCSTPVFQYGLLTDVPISPECVYRKLNKLDVNKASGPDGIPNLLLKNCAVELTLVLTYLFRLSISTSKLPKIWKSAYVTPVYKRKGDRSSPSSYRPISLTSCIGKTLESIVNNRLMTFLLENSLISENQFGFLPKHSTLDQLALDYHTWLKAVEKKETCLAAFLDLSSAFTSVPHEAILHKLPMLGVHGRILAWIRDYLSNRLQQTRIGFTFSSPSLVQSGVPQGSVIAPTLFIIFLNDLLTALESLSSLLPQSVKVIPAAYADDTLITVSSAHPALAIAGMNCALAAACTWAKTWGMKFNTSKTVCLCFAKHSVSKLLDSRIIFEGHSIPFSSEVKHLGVIFTADLKFKRHVEELCRMARREIFVLRLLKTKLPPRSNNLLLRIYKAYIRSRLEYCSLLVCGAGKTLTNCRKPPTAMYAHYSSHAISYSNRAGAL